MVQTMTKSKQPNFETNLEQLDKIVTDLEQGQLPLDQSLKAFEQGVKLIRDCQKALKDAEQKVQILTDGPDGHELSDLNAPE